MSKSLAVYHSYIKRLNEIVKAKNVSPLRRMNDAQFLLAYFETALIEAEKDFLDNEFPFPNDKYCKRTESLTAMGFYFTHHLN